MVGLQRIQIIADGISQFLFSTTEDITTANSFEFIHIHADDMQLSGFPANILPWCSEIKGYRRAIANPGPK